MISEGAAFDQTYIDGLVQDCSISSAFAVENCSLALSHIYEMVNSCINEK